MGKTSEEKQADLTKRLEQLQDLRAEICQEIEQIRVSGDLAPDGCWIVRYRAKGAGGAYWYYKWQSSEPIFITKNGQPSSHQYIGKAGSPAFFKAVEMMKKRTQIEALQQVDPTLELGLADLVEEATRPQKNQKSGPD